MTAVLRRLAGEGWTIAAADLAALSPYITERIKRFGEYATDGLTIPPAAFDPRLDLSAPVAGEAAHLLLDIGFLWTVYLDGEMNLLPQGVAISELDADELNSADKTDLAFDAQLLLSEGRHASGLKRFTGSPVECLITTVDLFAANLDRRLVIRGELATLEIETSLESDEVSVRAESQ
jgi:hypothetical protein